MHGNKKKQSFPETEKIFTMTSEGFMIVVRNNSFIDIK